jgi:predicted alpha/beta superfamily hydrolase
MMKKILCFTILLSSFINAQVTLRITAVPSNTPPSATVYLAGTINSWNPSSSNYIMQPDGVGALQITIPEGTGTVEYKFTRGSWSTVEGSANGGYLPNRTFTFTGSPQVINLTVLSWEDISGSANNSTAASNVQVLNPSFYIPQLNKTRRVWIYLPPDYFTTSKTYPVLYMQDGQNLFDNVTSFSGEWQIDETLNLLHSQGNYGAIVVGIDNGGSDRLNEYSPWVNSQYGGGQGDLYMQFIGETLKPYVDANFRTKSQSQYNAIIGSSMGALISTYGAIKYPLLFSKVGVFSPAYWFALDDLNNYINTTSSVLNNMRLYFVASQNESSTMVPNINAVRNNLIAKGVQSANTFTKIDSYGSHSESYWRGEFSAAYQWLFANEVLSSNEFDKNQVTVFQMNSNEFYVTGLQQEMVVTIYSISGQKVLSQYVKNGVNVIETSLPKGIYFIRGNLFTLKFVK